MDYKDLGLICNHCGKGIESKPDYKTISVVGFESMLHRHIHDKLNECVISIKGKAGPYSDQGKRDLYYEIDK